MTYEWPKDAAATLARLTGMEGVMPADLREMVRRGHLTAQGSGKDALYDVDELRRFKAVEELRQVRDQRLAWSTVSFSRWEAAEALSLTEDEFDALAARYELEPGAGGRFERGRIMALRATARAARRSMQLDRRNWPGMEL